MSSNRIFQNYHCHKEYTNVRISDSAATLKEYAARARELGHGILSSCEHGWQGNYYQTVKLAREFGLKPLICAEAYWVKDREEKDRSNCHIFIAAMNENGRQALNDVLSEANITGFYGQPRLDIPLILSLPKDDVVVTTACVAYWRYDDIEEITKQFAEHFGKNFFLEVQYHNTESQRELNRYILELHRKYNIPIIMGCDSHYIFPDQAQTRADFLASKGLTYENEDDWYLDYPDGETAYKRFAEQCVLSDEEICEAMENTNVFLNVEEYNSPVFNEKIKLPTLYPELSQDERNEIYKKLVWDNWAEYKKEVPENQWSHYEDEINKEIQTVVDTRMADYFIDNYYIIKKGKENGGWLTKTGRGSGVSFITNKLLGFTEVDRVSAKVHMYPERFMSTTRILESGSLPDLDQNCAPVEPFARAQKEILGEDHSYPMIAYGTMQKSAAWKLYAKSQGINFEIANAVSSQIRNYEFAVKHLNEEEAESVDIKDYIDDEFHEVYEKSKDYLGLVTSWSIAPCSYLLYSGSIRKEIGLVKVKDNLCCIMDGHWAEECHFLKNDLLKVSVVDLIYRAYHRIGMEPPSVPELLKMCGPNDPAWDIYARSCTLGINQCEQKGTSARVAKYKPKNISELAAFVAAIRPGFKSMYKTFESRQHFDYGVKAFDDLIQTEEMHDSFLLYQEQEMAALNYAGIEMSECYTAIKNIAKKRAEKVISYKNKFIRGFQRAIMEQEGKSQNDARAVAVKLWKIIEDSANYSFNACLTPDTKVMMADGTSLPLYELIFKWYDLDGDKPVKTFPELYALSLDVETGKVIRNRIIDVRFADFAKVYELTTADGFKVQCTSNHKFPTPDGVVALKHLSPGDCVYTLVDGEAVKFTKVESIVELQEECVLDIEMQAPTHNLFVNGGLLVSNSHSYCVALDSLYCAWLKAHHPLEFYETLLKISEEKNDKDKMYEIREEANDYFGISFPPFKFGQDNREIKADLETRAITNAITSIKGFSQKVADVLYECGQQKFEHFTDVLKYLFARSIKVAKVAPLISINYFSDYGNIPTLSAILRAFIILKEGNAKIIKKENVPDEMLFRVFEWACDSNDWAFKVNGQADLILTEYEEYLRKKPKPDAPLKTKIRYSLDVLGYADVVTGKPEDRKRLFIKDVTPLKSSKGDVWAYRVSTKSVGTGKEARITIKAGTYEKNPIKEGDIIKNPDVWKNPAGYWYLFDYQKESDFEN